MDKKYIYTVGYTLFQKGNIIDVNHLFDTLREHGVNFFDRCAFCSFFQAISTMQCR